ncbi:MAG TPA: reverse transcriptase family protein [Humisphaera sp.]|jgi:retron-type reverse transcriptase|nr:reverse transcriptase family protein [Humisphaera sp.]
MIRDLSAIDWSRWLGTVVVLVVLVLISVFDFFLKRANRKPRKSSTNQPAPRPTTSRRETTPIAPGQLDLPNSPAATSAKSVTATPSRPAPAPAQRPPEPRKNQTLNLDPGQFAPITDAQTKQQASAAGNLLRNLQFGLQSRIPPVSDPRTLLIDRALVGHGLLTPEDLVEIHKVGAEMEAARPDHVSANAAAEQAVRDLDEDRKQRKLQKQKQAAQRKKERADAIAKRRQTDIIFLGRGVSRGLADRRASVEKLTAAGLPLLATPADVAAALNISIPRLRWLAFHSDAAAVTHYIRFTIPKRSGGTRTLFAPHRDIAATQQWILEHILSKVPTHAAAHGFVSGRSTVSNATGHVKRDLVINCDLTDFFPTITVGRVRGIFQQLGYSPAAATVLSLLCTESPRRLVTYSGKPYHVATGPRALPQGACTSPALSNLAARRLDSRLAGIATKLGWTYSRYADDLTFSADGDAATKVGYLLARIRHITTDEGFAVNEKKTRVQRKSAAQSVTGIIVNERPGVPRDLARRLRAILHRAKTQGLAAQNRQKLPHFEAWLDGMIAYISMVNPNQAKPLREALDALGA